MSQMIERTAFTNMFTPRYTQIPTFMRVPYIGDHFANTHMTFPASSTIGLIGVPFDGGVTNRPGARHGPRAVRDISSLIRATNNGFNPYEKVKIYDLGDVFPECPFELSEALDSLTEQFKKIIDTGIAPVSCGGDHSITLPILRNLGKGLALIHFDAHCDTGGDYLGSKWHHGTPFRHAITEGLINPHKTIQIGIRGTLHDPDQWKFSFDSGITVITMEDFEDLGYSYVITKIKEVVGDSPVYVSFDVDCLDPVYAPGTGTPEIGGFTSREALRMLEGIGGLNVIGGDVVEVCPPFDTHDQITALTGATIMFEILCLVAKAIK